MDKETSNNTAPYRSTWVLNGYHAKELFNAKVGRKVKKDLQFCCVPIGLELKN
jgi:hypothetical protein